MTEIVQTMGSVSYNVHAHQWAPRFLLVSAHAVSMTRLHFNTTLALDDFTEDNGATRIIPASHKWESGRRGQDHEAIPAVCPAGSAV